MFAWLIQLLNHPAAPWIAAAIPPFWAMVAWWQTNAAWLAPLRREILLASQACDETPDDPERFAPHFHHLNDGLEQLPTLGAAWRAFRASLIDPGDRQVLPVFCSTRAESHFDLALLSVGNAHARRLHTLPLQLAGVGVLLTFVGLIGALQLASNGVTPGDAAAAQQAIRGMLGMAAFKFFASISGLLTAWLFHGQARAGQQRIEREFARLNGQLTQRFQFVTREQLLYEQLLAMRQIQSGHGQPVTAIGAAAIPPPAFQLVTLEPVIAVLREENQKLRELINARIPADALGSANPVVIPPVQPVSLEPVIDALREENQKLRELINARIPEGSSDFRQIALPPVQPVSLDPVIAVLREENQKLRDLIDERLPEASVADHALPAPVETVLTPTTTLLAPDPTAWRPLVEAVREEGRQMARELAHHLARELQGVVLRTSESTSPLSRVEQESWMRIVDRMELAARALERQSEGLDGLGELARETRRANEGSMRANREALEALITAVEGFNERMSSSFTRSAEALLERLAQNNQKIVAQVIEEFDGDRAQQVVRSLGRDAEVSELYRHYLSRRVKK
ncbi:MAG: hypothetical protein H7834_10705 [Magnetococcus sp. YQC-9]